MINILLITLFLAGCHASSVSSGPNYPPAQKSLMEPYSSPTIPVQPISEKSLGVGLFVVSAIAIAILKRK